MKTIFAVLLGSATYATVRYNVLKGVPWSDWPLYILNKAFGLSCLLLLLIEAIRRNRAPGQPATSLLPAAAALMLMHVIGSLLLLNPAYYPASFSGEKLTGSAGWALLLGVAAAVGFLACLRPWESVASEKLVRLGGFAWLASLHAALPGYSGWFQPATWPGHLPPITLLSFAAGLLALGAALRSSRRC